MTEEFNLSEKEIDSYHGFRYAKKDIKEFILRLKEMMEGLERVKASKSWLKGFQAGAQWYENEFTNKEKRERKT